MILEGLVTTLDADGTPHLAPMGRASYPEFRRPPLLLRPFPTSQHVQNLLRTREGVFPPDDDALLMRRPQWHGGICRGIVRQRSQWRRYSPEGAGSFRIFRITAIDDSRQRVHLERPRWSTPSRCGTSSVQSSQECRNRGRDPCHSFPPPPLGKIENGSSANSG